MSPYRLIPPPILPLQDVVGNPLDPLAPTHPPAPAWGRQTENHWASKPDNFRGCFPCSKHRLEMTKARHLRQVAYYRAPSIGDCFLHRRHHFLLSGMMFVVGYGLPVSKSMGRARRRVSG